MKVKQLLSQKNHSIFSITSNISVYDAVKLMSEKNIGALLVVENEKLVGILSERDYARKIVLNNKTSKGTLVNEIMTNNVISVNQDNTIEECMTIMSQKHIRHLPVLENNKVIGIVSIGDIVNAIIEIQKDTINHLNKYIQS